MPRYKYQCLYCDHVFDDWFTIEDYQSTVPCKKCGKDACRVFGLAGIESDWTNPIHSESLAIDPRDIEHYKEYDSKMGVSDVQYNKSGCPIFVNREQRRRYLKAHGFIDLDGGYGDG